MFDGRKKPGLISRIFGFSISDTKLQGDNPVPLAARPPGLPILIPNGDFKHMIAGSNYYRAAYDRVNDGSVRLELRCEAHNPHDPFAITVVHRGWRIGYVSQRYSADYHDLLHTLQREGPVEVEGEIITLPYIRSAVIYLPTVDQLKRWVETPPDERAGLLPRGIKVYLKRSGAFQDELQEAIGDRLRRWVTVTVIGLQESKGKYLGQTFLRFDSDKGTLGLMPAQYRDQAEKLFKAVEQAGPQRMQIEVMKFALENRLVARFYRYD